MRLPVLVTLSALVLAPGTPVWAQAPQAPPPAKNAAPDESWSAPGQAPPSEAPADASGSSPESRPSTPPPPSEEGWEAFPGASDPVVAPPPLPPPPVLRDAPPPVPDRSPTRRGKAPRPPRPPKPPAPPLSPNRYGLYGGRSLGAGHLGVGLEVGFPFVSARAVYGVLPRLDLGLGVDSVYGLMIEPRASARFTALDSPRASLAVVVDGGHAFFLRPPETEEKGARYLSGRRDWNVAPGLVFSFQGDGPRSIRPYMDLRCLVSFDTHPTQSSPLGGLPPELKVDAAVLVRLGAEFPVGEKTSYAVSLGADFRSRATDAEVMPTLSMGVVSTLF